jgi:uncharacterized membrane protein YcaP (DUF421 family)
MILLDSVFDWHTLLFGKENWDFLLHVIIKTVFMFIVVLVSLRLLGRRGIMKGVFQVLTIIMLGSSAGDPMLYREVGLVTATVVFIMTVILYRIADYVVSKYSVAEHYIEGKAIRLIKEGRFEIKNVKKGELSKDEIFADLRQKGISHLGQVKTAYMEAGGQISVFYYRDEEVKYGLPILPEAIEHELTEIKEPARYSCGFCGYTEILQPVKEKKCPVCSKDKWLYSIKEVRVM